LFIERSKEERLTAIVTIDQRQYDGNTVDAKGLIN